MTAFIGCCLVAIAFVLLRFVLPHPMEICRNNTTLRHVLYYSQEVVSWGLLIVGLILSFLSDIKIGLVILGCFLWVYKNSFIMPVVGDILSPFLGIPFLANPVAGLLGFILLVLGLVLIFIASLKCGFIAIGMVCLIVLIVRFLRRIEYKFIRKRVRKDPDYKPSR